MMPSSISALYYKWGDLYFYSLMLGVACVLMFLAMHHESYLLGFSAISAPAVAAFGDFKNEDSFAHYMQAVFVFGPLLAFGGWWIFGAGIALAGVTYALTKSIFWAEIAIILIGIVGVL